MEAIEQITAAVFSHYAYYEWGIYHVYDYEIKITTLFVTYRILHFQNINALVQPKSWIEVMQSIFISSYWECSIPWSYVWEF